jgi:hypothetical protein
MSFRFIPTRSRPVARATAATAPRAMPAMLTCWPTCCAPTATAGGSCRRSPIRALRALVRSRDDLVATRVALGNQLRSTLEACWPGAACIFCDITSPIGLAFLKRYPSAVSAARLSEAALRRFCLSQHYSGRRSPAELLARLHSAATALAGPITNEETAQLVRSMVAVLQPLVEQIAVLTRRIEHFVESLPDGQIIMSFPRAGHVCAAQILAELGDVRERFPTLDQLSAEAGGPGALPVRQDPQRGLPMGLQSPPAPGHHLPGRQLASRQRVGPRPLRRSACPRVRSPSCDPHPCPSLVARHLARMDRSHTL